MTQNLTGNTRIVILKRMWRRDVIAVEVEYKPDGWTDDRDGSYHSATFNKWRLATPQDLIALAIIQGVQLNVVFK